MYINPSIQRRARTFDASGFGGRAFDAAGASGFAFLQSQLEQIDTDLVKPLSAVTHPRDIPVEVITGWPDYISAYSANFASTGTKYLGLQGTNNTEIANVQADLQKGIWKVFNWTAGMVITWLDLQKMYETQKNGMPAPFSLQELYEEACAELYAKAGDYVTYWGFLGQPGLVNNTNVAETAVPNGASGHTTWTTKTPAEILNDINYLLNAVMANCAYAAQEGMPDRALVPYTQFALLTQPMTLGGLGGFQSIKEYVEKNCIAAHHGVDFKINFLPNDWISGQGAGSPATDRIVVYRNDKKSQYLKASPVVKAMTVPSTRNGGSYETMWAAAISQVVFKRTQTSIYGDGI